MIISAYPGSGLLENGKDTQTGKNLTSSLGKEDSGIDIRYVTEIIGIQPIQKPTNNERGNENEVVL